MKITYDPEADALYIYLSSARVTQTEEIKPGVIADFAKNGTPVGFEILSASKKLAKKTLDSLQVEFSLGKPSQPVD